MALKPGSFTSGEIEAVLLVGPIDPATYLLSLNSNATSFAILADWGGPMPI